MQPLQRSSYTVMTGGSLPFGIFFLPSWSQSSGDALANLCRILYYHCSDFCQGLHLFFGRASASSNDGASMSHPFSWRRCTAGNKSHHRLGHLPLYKVSCLLLGCPADLADEHSGIGAGVLLEKFQQVHEVTTHNGVSSYSHAGGLANTPLGQLSHCLISQGPASGDDTHPPRHMDVTRHYANLALSRGDYPGTIGTDEASLCAL